jgi:hypothetical protein
MIPSRKLFHARQDLNDIEEDIRDYNIPQHLKDELSTRLLDVSAKLNDIEAELDGEPTAP